MCIGRVMPSAEQPGQSDAGSTSGPQQTVHQKLLVDQRLTWFDLGFILAWPGLTGV